MVWCNRCIEIYPSIELVNRHFNTFNEEVYVYSFTHISNPSEVPRYLFLGRKVKVIHNEGLCWSAGLLPSVHLSMLPVEPSSL